MKNYKQPSKQLLLGLGITALLLMMTSCTDNQTTAPIDSNINTISPSLGKVNSQDRPEYVPGEVIVKFRSDITDSGRETALNTVGAKVRKKLHTRTMKRHGDNEGLTVISTSMSVPNAIASLQNSPDIVYAEPNYYVYHDATSNDPYYTNGDLWGMYGNATSPANRFGSQAGEAWANGNTGSSDVHIGVIDTGIMYDHEDLAGQIWTNPYETDGDGIDNDGNGYIDDIHGWDFYNGNNSVYDNTYDDHGTHVAGTIGAIGNNGVGVAGVVWNVSIISAKFLGGIAGGGETVNAILAVDYITDLKTRHSLHLPATNKSWGGGKYSAALEEAIERANDAEILFVAAAGNFKLNNDVYPHYPSSYTNDNIIAVAGIESSGSLYWTDGIYGTHYGAISVDLGAPAVGIYSAYPGGSGTDYVSYTGTSMATPHVTGAVALFAASRPNATARRIKNKILNSTLRTPALQGKTVTGGRLNLSRF